MVLISCSGDSGEEMQQDRFSSLTSYSDLVIGSEEQPFEYQLGRPVAVRTDSEGNIYIADKASLEIKVFSGEGEYLRSFGGRGRGPGEFHDINLMEFTEEEHLLILDRGLLQFVYITKDGEFISSHPVDLSGQLSQYYPASMMFAGDQTIGLFLNGAFPDRSPMFERPLFHVYGRDFQEKKSAFFPFSQLSIEGEFGWLKFLYHPGSLAVNSRGERMIYSPGVYTGYLYQFFYDEQSLWTFERKIKALPPANEPYIQYQSETEFERFQHLPGVTRNTFGGGFSGRLMHIDAGIHYLENDSFIQFYTEWVEIADEESYEEGNRFRVMAQIITEEGEIIESGHLFTLSTDRDFLPHTLINWRDEEGFFYLLDPGGANHTPNVQRFLIQGI